MNKHNTNTIAQRNADWLKGRSASAHGAPILIAEDSDSDIFFLLRAFAASRVTNPIFLVRNGAETMAYLEGKGKFANREAFPLPGIFLLDLRMPAPDGFEILRWRKTRPDLAKILIVAISNFDSTRSINMAYEAGASTFLSKPLNGEDVRSLVDSFEEYWELDYSTASLLVPKLE
jgi:CheY-like chemotaxis protein